MLSYISSCFNYLFNKESNEDSDDDYKENYLAEQLVDLEYVVKQEEKTTELFEAPQIPKDAICFQRTGVITFKQDNYILIDGSLYFDTSVCSYNCNVNDQVLYLGYKDSNESIIVVRILENKGLFWGTEDDVEENKFQVIKHILVGEVDNRVDRLVYIKESDLKFNLDDVEGTFIPVKGDWLELECKIQLDENNPSDVSMKQVWYAAVASFVFNDDVLTVISFKPLRSKLINAKVNTWTGTYGTCDRLIYFDKTSLINGYEPQVGSNVLVEAIESNQNLCTWRAIKIKENEKSVNQNDQQKVPQNIDTNFQIEKEKNINVTSALKFDNLYLNQTSEISLNLTNNSNDMYILNKWIILGKKRDSQIKVEPFLKNSLKFYPGQSFCFTITCRPKFLGKSTECLVILFRGFQIKRFIEINVIEEQLILKEPEEQSNFCYKTVNERIDNMKKIRKNEKSFVPGERPVKPPAFVAVKLGVFTIPEKIWNVVLGDSEQTIFSNDYDKIIQRIETNFPCLTQPLNIFNYIDKWHTLLYMEEVQANINMRVYDMAKVFLIRCNEYLCVEINGLSERRPSLVKGDRAIVKDIWVPDAPEYEGYIHGIKGDLVQMKFNTRFQETYNGSDVSIEFHFSRSVFRRSHQAVNYAISNLGPSILCPSRISIQEPQVPRENLKSIKWYNKTLNDGQKAAVTNILIAECRPMPYCIFGPPGTGKTITVIETILQILTLLPDSRILVATPSNSASNLVAERLIQYTNEFSGSIVRLIANYMIDSDNIPDVIIPFCATLDIAKEETTKPRHFIQNGININCNKSFIGRHRVTIGTCCCLGSLAQIGLPKGHFTHVIIDEAGQATEPEIMIPMTFIDKSNGQIIVAGDPMQLGPVVTSKYCKEFGMEESYMCRILECYPYQRDYVAYKNGYDNRLITKLNDNYRSIQEIISLPSEIFYDATLVARIDRSPSWVSKLIYATNEVLGLDVNTGGMFVHGVRGFNARSEDSPSWYNPQEASMVAFTTCKLLRKGITIDEIGIITPYIAQIKYLRLLFDSMGLAQPKIGTVEEFQGQERRIILISTVRSSESLIQEDQRHTLGFVKNPKRLNVALTRAQVCAILFCNPHLLSTDPLWKRVIAKAIKEDKYTGCDIPGFVDNE